MLLGEHERETREKREQGENERGRADRGKEIKGRGQISYTRAEHGERRDII